MGGNKLIMSGYSIGGHRSAMAVKRKQLARVTSP
jgi:hypothetical protein